MEVVQHIFRVGLSRQELQTIRSGLQREVDYIYPSGEVPPQSVAKSLLDHIDLLLERSR